MPKRRTIKQIDNRIEWCKKEIENLEADKQIVGFRQQIKDLEDGKQKSKPKPRNRKKANKKDSTTSQDSPNNAPRAGRSKKDNWYCPECGRTYRYGLKEGTSVMCECGKALIVLIKSKVQDEKKPESEQKHIYRCNKCKTEFDEPRQVHGGVAVCPKCSSLRFWVIEQIAEKSNEQ